MSLPGARGSAFPGSNAVQQHDDPGALGAGALWLQTPDIGDLRQVAALRVRNAIDDAWVEVAIAHYDDLGNMVFVVAPIDDFMEILRVDKHGGSERMSLDNDDTGFNLLWFDGSMNEVGWRLNATGIHPTNAGLGGFLTTSNLPALLVGADDPASGAGVAAKPGSLFLRNEGDNSVAGDLYVKSGAGDTEWVVAGGVAAGLGVDDVHDFFPATFKGLFLPGVTTANRGEAYAVPDVARSGELLLAVALLDGITDAPGSSSNDNWHVHHWDEFAPVQLRVDATTLGHPDTFGYSGPWRYVSFGFSGAPTSGTFVVEHDGNADADAVTVDFTDTAEAMAAALVAGWAGASAAVFAYPSGSPDTGANCIVLYSNVAGVTIQSSSLDDGAVTAGGDFLAVGVPAPMGSTIQALGTGAPTEGHLFIRDNGDSFFDASIGELRHQSQNWNEVGVTRFIDGSFTPTFSISQGASTVTAAAADALLGDFERMGTSYGRLRFRCAVTVTAVVDPESAAIVIDLSALLDVLLPTSYMTAVTGEIVGHYTATLANGNALGHLIADGSNALVELQDPAQTIPAQLATALTNADVIILDFDFLISDT